MYRTSKRIVDFVLALVGLMALWPLLLIVAIAVYISMGRPIIFRQERAGLQGEPFTLFKFRTMTDERDESGQLLSDEHRLTRVGALLRRFSLDELPQLWNVLKGDMSVIGPRPLPVKYLPRYNKVQIRRHDVPQGLVGWAGVNGRNAISWEKKFELDVWYVENCSLWLDTKIFFMAVGAVMSGHGISEDNHATAREFLGTPEQADSPNK